MVLTSSITTAAAAILLALPNGVHGFYTKNSPVLQVNGKSYDRLIAQSNYTSIVEFYAPWCGHCKNLKPAYEKAAKNLAGLAKVAAVDCDDESNKAFCGSMGVQGFPTLKIVKPGKKRGKPIVEDYEGARTAKGIVDAVTAKIPNHVKRLTDKDFNEWLRDKNTTSKAILFSDKGTTSALLKSLAVDFLGSISIAQVRDNQEAAVQSFGISSYPTLVLLPGGDSEGLVYDGEMKKKPMIDFLSHVAAPNPDPAPKKAKTPKAGKETSKEDSKKKEKAEKAEKSFEKASSAHASSEASEEAAGATSIVLDEPIPTESPDPIVESDAPKPIISEDLPDPIPELSSPEELQKTCLGLKTSTCLLVFVPDIKEGELLPEPAQQVLSSLARIAHTYKKRKAPVFPFYSVPSSNAASTEIQKALGLKASPGVDVVVVNSRRRWWRHYHGGGDLESITNWIGSIQIGDVSKEILPESLVPEEVEEVEEVDEKPPIDVHDEL